MKKKLVAFALAAVCATGCAIGLSACNKDGGDNGGTATDLTAEEWTAAIVSFSTGANFSMEMYSGEIQAFGAKIQQTTFYQFYYEGTTKCEDIYTVTGLETQAPVFYRYNKVGDGDWTRNTTNSTSYADQLSNNVGIPIEVVPHLDRNDFTVEDGKYKAASITLQGTTVTNVELTFNPNKKLSLITCDYSGYGGLHVVINSIGSTSITVPDVQITV